MTPAVYGILEDMVRLIIYIVIGLFALSFFGVSLQHLVENPTTQENFSFFVSLLEQGWESVLSWVMAFLEPGITLIKNIIP
jgi:hypothetical protein